MRTLFFLAMILALLCGGCARRATTGATLQPTGFGAALVESSGGKQIASIGMALDQPLVVQVNDAQGTAVPGAAVYFQCAAGCGFNPAAALTDSSGQVSTEVSLGAMAGRYQLLAYSFDRAGKRIELKVEEIALGYQQTLGRQLDHQYCQRCHDPESTPERVSNLDNLVAKPHVFTDGSALNKLNDNDLAAIISHGGPALGRSPEMPPYAYTLSKTEIQALTAYIRAVADPPYHTTGVLYAKN